VNQPWDARYAPARQTAGAPFGPRLRMERERRRISLESIAANTKISVGLLADLEQDDVSRWPSGIFRRSFVKAYAQAIGLDPDEVAREFLERFPDQEAAGPFQELCHSAEPAPVAAPTALRLTLARCEAPFAGRLSLRAMRSRGSAVAWDAGVIFVAALSLFVLLGQFWRPLGIFALTYYSAGIFLLGNTPGVCLFVASRPGPRGRGAQGPGWLVAKSAASRVWLRTLINWGSRALETSTKEGTAADRSRS
jgi:transcriptional regulator with XRE-family HTH domain